MSEQLETRLRKLGLPILDGQGLERLRGDVFLIRSISNVPYLLAVTSESGDLDNLRNCLENCNDVGAAIVIGPAGDVIAALRRSFRTGDIDHSTAFEKPTTAQLGFEFQNNGSRTLLPLTGQLENVLFEVHSAMRDIDGLHAPDALDEICKLLYAKLFDEENAVKSGFYCFQRAIYRTAEECASSVRHLYKEAVSDDETLFGNRIPAYARSRGVFRDPILLSSQAIARCVALLEPYDIGASPVDIKGRAFQNVLLPATRAGMGQYFTPKSVITLCISLLAPSVRDVVIDPFCGSGHFLTSALDYVRARGGFTERQFHEFAFSRLHGLEKSDRMVRIAMTDMRLHGDGHSNIRCVDSLLNFESYADLRSDSFDIVATNPPFGVDLPREALGHLGPFRILDEQRGSTASTSLEIVALDRCISLLRPGGRMAIVLPDGILGNRNTAYVREWVKSVAILKAIISLPIETFTPFGANIKTSVLILRKYNIGEEPSRKYNVFLADLKSIGHDAAGRPIQSDDFSAIEANFDEFIRMEGW